MNKLYLVVPCYNEQEVLPETSKRLLKKVSDLIVENRISPESRIVFVDDGSKDDTWNIIEGLHGQNPVFQGIKLSRNKGHQNALLAGLMTVKEHCDTAISLDADLQDDTDAIDEMLLRYEEGCEVVYGVRSSRKTDSFFKKSTALLFYKLMSCMGVETVYNHADYRLMSKRALESMEKFSEVNLFLRGIVPLIGFKSTTVSYKREKRFAGESKYPLKKMLSFAWDGITSFSVKPIKMISFVGALSLFAGICMLLTLFVLFLCGREFGDKIFYTALACAFFGFQFLSTGIVGEYIGKTYMESKHRPRYIIETYLK
ncbi:MAG: glycosyltransferase family 2 protein [Eubacteriales bacterium]|nr:glycosyltransferase family 2 protein [Eubacteriales bacterium]MDD4421916.1 glycosyltransferase family 2 protein [Eubacteriales bacterium]